MRALYRLLMPAERFILDITFAAAVIDGACLSLRGIGIDWMTFAASDLAAFGLIALGLFYRRSERSEAIAAALVCTGLFIAFSLWLATFNYLLMPVRQVPIDALLARLDAAVGYHWTDTLSLAAQHPAASRLLKFVYLSTLPQVALLIVVLGLSGRIRDLHAMCLTLSIGAIVSIVFWGLFPSVGPTWLAPHADATELALAQPIMSGTGLYDLVTHGVRHVSPGTFTGLIAFPSFHTVLASILIWFSRRIRWLFPVMLVMNLLVLPALLVHGSHHLVDIPGGIATFAFALFLACSVMARGERRQRTPIRQSDTPAVQNL